jgi:hypothetical protein
MKKIALFMMLVFFAGYISAQTKTEVKVADLSQVIKDNVAKDFAGYTIDKALKVDKKGVITYHLIVKKDKEELVLIYDKDSKFVKKEAKKEKTEKKENKEPKKDAKKPK